MKKSVAAITWLCFAFVAFWIFLTLVPAGTANAAARVEQPLSPLPTPFVPPTEVSAPTPLTTISPDASPWSSQNLELVRTYAFSGAEWLDFVPVAATSPQHNMLLYDSSTSIYNSDTQTFTFALGPLVLVDMDNNEMRMVGVGRSPSWSPSGAKAIFDDFDSDTNEWGLSVFDLETGKTRRIARFRSEDIYRGGPFWISEDRVVLGIGPDDKQTALVVDTNTGTSELLLSDYLRNWFLYNGASEIPTVRDTSTISSSVLLDANGILYLMQYRNKPFPGHAVTNLLATNGSTGPKFEPNGNTFVSSNDFLGSMLFTPGETETQSVRIPMISLFGGTYYWTPDGAALLIAGRQGSEWSIVNRDGTGYRPLDNTFGATSIATTRNYLIVSRWDHFNIVEVYRVAGTK